MISIREMTSEDIEEVLDIESQSFSCPWSREDFLDELKNKLAYYLVLEQNQKIIGYAGLWKIVEEGHITNIAIRKESQEKGMGYRLVMMLINKGRQLGIERFTLEVRKSNLAAIRLYQKVGFNVAGERKEYYVNPKEDALIMWYE